MIASEGDVLPAFVEGPPPPSPSRIPRTTSLDDVLAYWESGAPEKGLVVPLKHWAEWFDPSEYKSEAVKLSNIRFIWEEFTVGCSSDFDQFEMKFPGLRYQFTKLLKAVREARKVRGAAKSQNQCRRQQ